MGKPDETTKRWLDPASLTPRVGSIYPAPFVAPLAGREKRALGDPLGLTQFGVNLVTLGPRSGIGMKTRTSSFMCSKGR
ncbi:MAG TPA: hypothetical protein VKD02_04875 [Methyloceanibacter sp.]|nr:hypothetical protein [Methyloceanibacter sp.]